MNVKDATGVAFASQRDQAARCPRCPTAGALLNDVIPARFMQTIMKLVLRSLAKRRGCDARQGAGTLRFRDERASNNSSGDGGVRNRKGESLFG